MASAKATSTIARFGSKITGVITAVKGMRAVTKIACFFRSRSLAKCNARIVRYEQMELKQANTQGQKNNLAGRVGELKAGIEPNTVEH